mmetsp:Transcript_66939/g.188502  ORF Transcript_66939/g.188502 Transcript_66939/m.188502 type:complete len:490 (-) Transcript_66939:51-1520(-)
MPPWDPGRMQYRMVDGEPPLQVYSPVSWDVQSSAKRALGVGLHVGGLVAFFYMLSSGHVWPFALCTALATSVALPSPLGQIPPLTDTLLVYVWAARVPLCAASAAWVAWGWWAALGSGSPWDAWGSADQLWGLGTAIAMMISVWTGWGDAARVRGQLAPPESCGPAAARPRRPCLAWLHPYFYSLFSELPHIRIERVVGKTRSFLDVWVRDVRSDDQDGAGRPIFFFIHGGGWVGGGARLSPQAPLLHALAERGWLVVSCEYRKACWPQYLEDCVEALRFTCAVLAPQHGADVGALTVSGASAGGHLATLAMFRALHEHICPVRSAVLFSPALDPKDHAGATLRFPLALPCDPLRARSGQSLFAWFFERRVLRGNVNFWSTADPPALLEGVAAAKRGTKFPATLIVHGTHDSLVPIEHSRQWIAALASLAEEQRDPRAPPGSVGGEHRLLEVTGARHAYEIAPAAVVEAVFDGVLAWLESSRRPVSGGF